MVEKVNKTSAATGAGEQAKATRVSAKFLGVKPKDGTAVFDVTYSDNTVKRKESPKDETLAKLKQILENPSLLDNKNMFINGNNFPEIVKAYKKAGHLGDDLLKLFSEKEDALRKRLRALAAPPTVTQPDAPATNKSNARPETSLLGMEFATETQTTPQAIAGTTAASNTKRFVAELIADEEIGQIIFKLREKKTSNQADKHPPLKHSIDIARDILPHFRAALNDTTTGDEALVKELLTAYEAATKPNSAGTSRRVANEINSLTSNEIRKLDADVKTAYKTQAKGILMYVLHHSQQEIEKQDKKGKLADAAKIDGFAREFLKISKQLSLITAS